MRYIALIPGYNPGPAVKKVVEETLLLVDKVILVDDGCEGEHREFFDKYRNHKKVKVLRHEENLGKGWALMTGFKEALTHDFDYLITLDSDGQHRPGEIGQFKELLAAEHYDLVVGRREVGGKMPQKSRWGNSLTAAAFNLFLGAKVMDTQSGFRAIGRGLVERAVKTIVPGRYETEMKILIQAVREQWRVGQVPISTIYFDRNKGSQFKAIRDSLLVVRQFGLFAAAAFSAWLIDYFIFTALTVAAGSIYFLYANLISKGVSMVYYYLVNKYLVFWSYRRSKEEVARYAAAVAVNIVVVNALLYVLAVGAGWNELAAKPAADAVMFVFNFFILRLFVYK